MVDVYINNEAKNGFKDWTREGLKFLSNDIQNTKSTGELDFHQILQNAIRELEDDK